MDEIDRLRAELQRLTEERDHFSQRADTRHDQLWEARRQRDDVAQRLARLTEEREQLRAALETLRENVGASIVTALICIHNHAKPAAELHDIVQASFGKPIAELEAVLPTLTPAREETT